MAYIDLTLIYITLVNDDFYYLFYCFEYFNMIAVMLLFIYLFVYCFLVDLDEIPNSEELLQAATELKSGKCDMVVGLWRERLSIDGSPIDIKLSKDVSLQQQFPYSCSVSKRFMPGRTTVKILLYRSSYRLVSGQHDVWCNIDMRKYILYTNNKLLVCVIFTLYMI